MTAYELLDISQSIGNRVDVQWGLFITVHLAIFGGVIYVDRPLRALEKAGALALYLPLLFLNYRVMSLHMNLLRNAWREIAERAQHACCLDNDLVQFIASDVEGGRFLIPANAVLLLHLSLGLLVTLAIIFDRAIGDKQRR